MAAAFRPFLQNLLAGKDLESADMRTAMLSIFENQWTPIQIAGFLTALRAKGETSSEIAEAARVMREKVNPVEGLDQGSIVDVVGTGGDGSGTFNISTAAAFAAAAAGVKVAKHCNRALSSASGSSDVLAAYGIDISVKSPEQIARCVEEVGIGFMFAPNHHPGMKYAAPVRKDLAVRTIFNVLGPLTNPAGAQRQMTGVFEAELVDVYAETLKSLGSRRVLIVHGDGLDEITVAGETQAAELKEDGSIERYVIRPEDFGFDRHPLSSIQVRSPEESKEVIASVFDGKEGPCREAVLMTAGAAVYIAGLTPSLAEGAIRAAEVIDAGAAKRKFGEFAASFGIDLA